MDKEFLQEWLYYGEEKKEEPYRFVAYYIAFNFLYNDCCRCRQGTESELNQIYNFIDKWKNTIEINPYKILSSDSEYYKQRVISEKPYYKKLENGQLEEKHTQSNLNKIRNKDIYEIFKALYIVRCNLFHGSKSMRFERNKGLLRDGSKILGSLLSQFYKQL